MKSNVSLGLSLDLKPPTLITSEILLGGLISLKRAPAALDDAASGQASLPFKHVQVI